MAIINEQLFTRDPVVGMAGPVYSKWDPTTFLPESNILYRIANQYGGPGGGPQYAQLTPEQIQQLTSEQKSGTIFQGIGGPDPGDVGYTGNSYLYLPEGLLGRIPEQYRTMLNSTGVPQSKQGSNYISIDNWNKLFPGIDPLAVGSRYVNQNAEDIMNPGKYAESIQNDGGFLSGIGNWLNDAFSNPATLAGVLAGFALPGIGNAIGSSLGGALSGIGSGLSGAGQSIAGALGNISPALGGAAQSLGTPLAQFGQNVGNALGITSQSGGYGAEQPAGYGAGQAQSQGYQGYQGYGQGAGTTPEGAISMDSFMKEFPQYSGGITLNVPQAASAIPSAAGAGAGGLMGSLMSGAAGAGVGTALGGFSGGPTSSVSSNFDQYSAQQPGQGTGQGAAKNRDFDLEQPKDSFSFATTPFQTSGYNQYGDMLNQNSPFGYIGKKQEEQQGQAPYMGFFDPGLLNKDYYGGSQEGGF